MIYVGYETFNVTFIEPTDYSEAIYNYLLFPVLHPFKIAPSNHTEADEVKIKLKHLFILISIEILLAACDGNTELR